MFLESAICRIIQNTTEGENSITDGYTNACVFSSINYSSSVSGIAYPDTTTGKYPDLNDEDTYPIGNATSIITVALFSLLIR